MGAAYFLKRQCCYDGRFKLGETGNNCRRWRRPKRWSSLNLEKQPSNTRSEFSIFIKKMARPIEFPYEQLDSGPDAAIGRFPRQLIGKRMFPERPCLSLVWSGLTPNRFHAPLKLKQYQQNRPMILLIFLRAYFLLSDSSFIWLNVIAVCLGQFWKTWIANLQSINGQVHIIG